MDPASGHKLKHGKVVHSTDGNVLTDARHEAREKGEVSYDDEQAVKRLDEES